MTMTPITVAYGDGIGPEIMRAVMSVLQAANAKIAPEIIEIGEKAYLQGHSSGIANSAWESLRRTKVFLKAPITTPQGGGYKSLNVTVRKTLGLYSNVRPVEAFSPYVKTNHPAMDLVIVRENEEDLYAGIEHRQTQDVYQCLKLISRPGSERIIRYAFEYAVANGRKRVSCFSKDNIMKLTDGLFHKIFNEVAAEYPQIQNDHFIIDIGSARLANNPERFDVIVTSNLYGDIISDIAAEVSGSVGLGASLNLGQDCAMFEAIHGSAPDIAGKDLANPSGLLLSAIAMLVHIGQAEAAKNIKNAWSVTLESGMHTADIFQEGISKRRLGTQEFAAAVVSNLGKIPTKLRPAHYASSDRMQMPRPRGGQKRQDKKLVGVDIFVDSQVNPEWTADKISAAIAERIQPCLAENLELKMISNRGVKVWPGGFPETFCVDHWRCRVLAKVKSTTEAVQTITFKDVLKTLGNLDAKGIEVIKTENLYTFDGAPGYSLGQGE